MSTDPFSQPTQRVVCKECGGTDHAHFVWCSKLDEPKRRH